MILHPIEEEEGGLGIKDKAKGRDSSVQDIPLPKVNIE
jgi:hypothetical protein